MNTPVKPKIPADFTKPSMVGTICFMLYTLSMFLLPASLVYLFYTNELLHPLLLVLVSIPLLILSGQGMHLMGWMGHEGLHFNFHSSRMVSALIGIFFSSIPVLFLEMGMALDHWTHHRYTNTSKDPDLKMFEIHQTFWSRLLRSRGRSNRHYLRRVMKLITGKPLDDELTKIILPFSLKTIRRLALFNLICNLFWGVFFVGLALVDFTAFVIFFLIPMVFASALSGLRPYLEHNGTGKDFYNNTRSRSSFLWTLMDFGGNYHFEHHLYPNVPQWRLPKLNRYLKSRGFINPHEDGSMFKHYRFASKNYLYPK